MSNTLLCAASLMALEGKLLDKGENEKAVKAVCTAFDMCDHSTNQFDQAHHISVVLEESLNAKALIRLVVAFWPRKGA